MKYAILTLFCILMFCKNGADIAPNITMRLIGGDHCWPYNLKVYEIGNLPVDSMLYQYPRSSYYGLKRNYDLQATWKRFSDSSSHFPNGLKSFFIECDAATRFPGLLGEENDVLYAGSYTYMLGIGGAKSPHYNELLLIDLSEQKMYILDFMNYSY